MGKTRHRLGRRRCCAALVAIALAAAGGAAPRTPAEAATARLVPPPAADFNAAVLALVEHGGQLVAGGRFTTADGAPAEYLARWDGVGWSAVGPPLDGPVHALAVQGGHLVVGGEFTHAGAVTVNHIARWDGATWSGFAAGTDGPVRALLVQSDYLLYAGGAFAHAGSVEAPGVARWIATSWSAVGKGLDGEVRALAYPGALVAGGDLRTREGSGFEHRYLARFDGTRWATPAAGLDGPVQALVVYQGSLVMGGGFQYADYVTPALGVARLIGTEWSALGIGVWEGDQMLPAEVRCLAVWGDDLLAGGTFTRAYYQPAERVARWDGAVWSGLGAGVDGPVDALCTRPEALFAGGEFGSAGGQPALRVAGFDGDSWYALRTTPILVHDLEAAASDGVVRLGWRLAPGAPAGLRAVLVSRAAQPQGPFEARARLEPEPVMGFEEAYEAGVPLLWYGLQLEALDGKRVDAGRVAVPAPPSGPGLRLDVLPADGTACTVSYALGGDAALPVQLDLFDVRGRRLCRLDDGLRRPGVYVRSWDRRDAGRQRAARGVYLLHLRAGGHALTRKLVLARP